MSHRLKAIRVVLKDALGHFDREDGWAIASHVSLSALMALFPFLLFVAALASFLGTYELAQRVADLIFETWPPEIARPVASQVTELLTEPRGDILTFGALIALVLASNGVEAARVGLNRAYRMRETRGYLMRRLQSLAFVVIGAIALLTLAFLLVLAPVAWQTAVRHLPVLESFSQTVLIWRFIIASFVLFAALIAAHGFLPNRRQHLRAIWPGVLFTLIFWIMGAAAFARYLQNFNTYTATYAGLASLMIAIIFLYILAVILILGGEINAAIMRLRERPSD